MNLLFFMLIHQSGQKVTVDKRLKFSFLVDSIVTRSKQQHETQAWRWLNVGSIVAYSAWHPLLCDTYTQKMVWIEKMPQKYCCLTKKF